MIGFYTKGVVLLLLVLILCTEGYSQSVRHDDYQVKIAKSTAVNDVGYLLSEANKIKSANGLNFQKIMDALSMVTVKMSESQTCYYHFLQSYNLGLQGKYIVAKKDLESGFKKCTSVANKVRYSALLANLYVISNDFELAINRLDYAIEHIDEVDDKELVQSVYSRAALVYRLVNHNELSIKFSELILNSDASDALKCSAKTNVLRILIKSNQNQVKEKDVRGAIAFCEEAEVYIYSNLLRLDWLDFMLNQNIKNYSIIKLVLNEVTTYQSQIDNTHYVNLISIKDSLFAKIYNKLGYEEEFLKFAKFTLDSSKALGNTKQKIEVLALLEKYYRMKGDFELAYDYLDKKNKAEALSFNQEQAKIMAFQTVKHNNLAKTQQIKFLNNQNQLLSLEKALTEKKSTNQKLVILFLFSLMGFMVLWGFRSRRVQNMYKHLSETDNMTGIYNRKGFRDFAESLLLQSKKEGRPVAMAIFDLDRFKRINDKYGHLKGDWAIKKTIAQCQLVQNDKITIGRIGGEEFAIVMRDSTSEELSEFVEECRIMIENIDSSATGHDFVITASFGVTSTNVSGYVYSKLLSDADHAMYDAKTSGRNMVINYKYNLI
jgi:diguanylate cyclase (GGDEF)-like protein